jgi:hypothetical protein
MLASILRAISKYATAMMNGDLVLAMHMCGYIHSGAICIDYLQYPITNHYRQYELQHRADGEHKRKSLQRNNVAVPEISEICRSRTYEKERGCISGPPLQLKHRACATVPPTRVLDSKIY